MKSLCDLKRSSSIPMKDSCYSEQQPDILMHSSHHDKAFKKYVGIQNWPSLLQPLTKIYFHFLTSLNLRPLKLLLQRRKCYVDKCDKSSG